MAINKKLIHFKNFEKFNSLKLSANEENTKYTLGVNGEVQDGTPDILYQSIVWIKNAQKQWTHGQLYDSVNWVEIDENTALTSNPELVNVLNLVYDTNTELDSKVATSKATVSLLNQTY
jgi:hypothetical protein